MLIFEEIFGPETGSPRDADPAHRCAVRLTAVPRSSHGNGTLVDPLNGSRSRRSGGQPPTHCPSPCASPRRPTRSTARVDCRSPSPSANVVAGRPRHLAGTGEDLGVVPAPPPSARRPDAAAPAATQSSTAGPAVPLLPALAQSPLTFSVPTTFRGSATRSSGLIVDTADAAPEIARHQGDGLGWDATSDLLSSARSPEGMRAGDRERWHRLLALRRRTSMDGARHRPRRSPASTGSATATAGNIGRDALAHAVLPAAYRPPLDGIVRCATRCPARRGRSRDDGTDPPARAVRLPDAGAVCHGGRLRAGPRN